MRRYAFSPESRGQRQNFLDGTSEVIVLMVSWVAAVLLQPHVGSSDRVTTTELLSKVVTWSVLGGFARRLRMENLVCDGFVIA